VLVLLLKISNLLSYTQITKNELLELLNNRHFDSMFNFFGHNNKQETFAPLEIDMHCHLLPNVDDGSKSVAETIGCLRIMGQVGYKRIILTPHFQARYPNQEDDIQQRFKALKEALANENDPTLPEVVAISGEYRFDENYCRRPDEGSPVVPLPGKRLLCEFSLHRSGKIPFDLFDAYKKKGFTLILAHPERYPYLGPAMEEVERMKEMGFLFQLNLLSLDGFYGEGAMQKGWSYVDQGLVHYLGTDLHNMHYANSLLRAAQNKRIRKLVNSGILLNSSFLDPQRKS